MFLSIVEKAAVVIMSIRDCQWLKVYRALIGASPYVIK
jgi:hypothetical protein